MLTIKEAFRVNVGYSDHTLGIEIPIAAVVIGASVIIEKHLTLDKDMEGSDHKSLLGPDEFKLMVHGIRNVSQALGNGIKKSSKSEAKNIIVVRKSIVAARTIEIGESFNANNITIKRPGNGISPMRWDEIMGQVAQRNYKEDDLI